MKGLIDIINRETERVFIIGVQLKGEDAWCIDGSLDELEELVGTAGGEVAGRGTQRLDKVNAATFIGPGKAREFAEQCTVAKVDTVVFDEELSSAQGRNLEKIFECKILDRTALILDIFSQRARTREGKLQVELAQLNHLLPRLTRFWTHLSRQKGGIGMRGGEGESQLEVDRRRETANLIRKHGGKTEKVPEVASRPSRQQRSDKEKALELLLGTNSTITEKDEAFLSAAKKGKLDEVKSLLAEGVDVDCSDAFSCTGLFWAAANNHKSIVEYLIEKGANLNAGAGVGGTPLARAAYEGHVEVVELLIAKGADVNAKDVSGGSPLDSADESVADLLRKHGAKRSN